MSRNEKETCTDLIRTIMEADPHINSDDLQRMVMKLCNATEELTIEYGIDSDRIRRWSQEIILPETCSRYSRSARNGETKEAKGRKSKVDREYEVPNWYSAYLRTNHWSYTKRQAACNFPFQDTCIFNADHPRNDWHHRQYDRVGLADGWMDIVPVCRECHSAGRKRGPRVPSSPSRDMLNLLQSELGENWMDAFRQEAVV